MYWNFMESFKEIVREKEVILVKDKQTTKPAEIGSKCNSAKLWMNSVFRQRMSSKPYTEEQMLRQ